MTQLTPEFIEGMYYAICQKQATNIEIESIISQAKTIKQAASIIRNLVKAQPFINQFHGLNCNWMDHFFCVGQQPTPFQALLLSYTGINRFVDLTENEQIYLDCLPDGVSYYKTTIANDTPNKPEIIEPAVRAIIEPIRQNQRVYLHCQSGFSRSAIVASVVMSIRLNISYSEAMKVVKIRRPIAQPQMDLLSREDAEFVISKFNI